MSMEIKQAVRRALPLQLACFGPENSGKTLSALLLAKGLAGKDGKVCAIDTERGRASLYADNPRIRAAMPEGFGVLELDSPYHPDRFVEALNVVEARGYAACVIDSVSDSWNGPGGCEDIAENLKNMWAKPKMANRKMMTRIKLSGMHIICCLKAQEKTRIVEGVNQRTGKSEKQFIPLGVQPVCEKNFFYPILMAFSFDPVTHLATVTKSLEGMPQFEPKLITVEDGERIRLWNEGAEKATGNDQLIGRARMAADSGLNAYSEFYASLTNPQKLAIRPTHEENKARAKAVDAEQVASEAEDVRLLREAVGDDTYHRIIGANGVEKIEEANQKQREEIIEELRRCAA